MSPNISLSNEKQTKSFPNFASNTFFAIKIYQISSVKKVN